MSWRDKLEKASFRGIPFFIDTTESQFGRKNIFHTFPFSDKTFVEDTGKDTDQFTLNGYVIQSTSNDFNYFDDRDKLINALRGEGAGILIHPFLGKITVALAGKVNMSESFKEGGMARFTMPFKEVEQDLSTIHSDIILDFVSIVDDATEDGFNKLKDSYGQMRGKLDSSIKTYYTKTEVTSDVSSGFGMLLGGFSKTKDSISSVLNKVRKDITTAISDITDVVTSACDLADLILDTVDHPLQMIGIPTPVSKVILGTCSFAEKSVVVNLPGDTVPKDMGSSMVDAYVSMEDFGEDNTTITTTSIAGYDNAGTEDVVTRNPDASWYGGRLDDITVDTANSAAQAVDRIYIINMFRASALMNATRIAVRTEAASYEKLMELLKKITDAIDTLLYKLADESASTTYSDYNISIDNTEIFTALEDVRSSFVEVMKAKGASLSKITKYKVPPAVIPTLVLAYDRYNDVNRCSDIFERNKVATIHPGFLPQGELIELLNE